ncbi:septum formation initiator [Sphingomonas aliaeris]|uniref:Septum formation initiator n=1 Tax=Sphingomonas aliaeris TaxID=2759526 RepID=A0A974S481_9SPHN|nr:septum formation initiator [Sphingomonas aliaeris]QQV76810.1 septum formation initiator [Sphingomonas aliaeris]
MMVRLVWGLAMLLAGAAAFAQDRPAVAVTPTILARSAHRIALRGRGVDYTAEAGLVPVSSKPRRQDATAGYISYSRTAGADRPVLFVFNGGPGAASAFLQMGALGPFRAHVPQDPTAPLPAIAPIAANTDTVLDIADLVFIDPPGTGFSTIAADADAAFYRSVQGDADAVAQLARAWLAAHGRSGAPIHILGESYGTIRAAAMVDALRNQDPGLKLRGVLLLGQALNMIETSQRPDNVVTYPVALPILAAIACYHHVRPQQCTPENSVREASAYAETYLTALFRGRALDATGRTSVAAKLAELTGIPSAYYLAHDLRITKERFRVELLRQRNRVLGRYDARYTAPRPAGTGDTVGPDAFSAVSDLYGKAVIGQLARIGVRDPQAYRVIIRGGDDWRYGSGDSPFNDWPFMARLEAAMAAEPELRLFVGTGLYDLTTTVGAADYLVAQSALAADRISAAHYPAGHVAYSDDASWRALMRDIRAFLTTGSER